VQVEDVIKVARDKVKVELSGKSLKKVRERREFLERAVSGSDNLWNKY
jgi:histidine ammonia-lyase